MPGIFPETGLQVGAVIFLNFVVASADARE
jgi:hypothetical protein